MLVRMKIDMSGTFNGEPWPAAGGTIDLPDTVALKVITAGQGEAVPQRDADVETADDSRPVELRDGDDETVVEVPSAEVAPDRDSIIRDLEALDQKVDKRKSTETLLQELEAATAPEAGDGE